MITLLQKPFLKFLLIGVINTCIGFSIMFICLSLFQLGYWISSATGNSVGAIISYFLNRRYTFNSHVKVGIGLIRFSIVILVCYFLSYKISLETVGLILSQNYILNKYGEEAALLIGSGIYTVSNYMGQRFFVFQQSVMKEA